MNYLNSGYIWSSPFPRPMTVHIALEFANRPVIGVEIGVFEGENADNILDILNISKLYLVDPYVEYDGYNDVLSSHLINGLDRAKSRLSRYKDKTVWIFEFAETARLEMEELLDFVYIDGNHRYEYVQNDLMNYYPLVKSGGFIGGHDYFNNNSTGVKKAVDEFVNESGVKLELGLYGNHSDWWVQKS